MNPVAVLPTTIAAITLGGPPPSPATAISRTARLVTKPASFSLLEDYDRGDELAEVARYFALMRGGVGAGGRPDG